MIIMDGKSVSKSRISKLKADVIFATKTYGRSPKLCVIQVGDNEASNSYIRSKIKRGKEALIDVELLKFDDNVSEERIIQEIDRLNDDYSIDGIIIQQPTPKHINTKKLMNLVKSNKDADGFSSSMAGKLFLGEEGIRPATPYGILSLLNEYSINVSGLNVVVIGRSNIVGMPIAKMLLDLNATVTICHSKTRNISFHTKHADLIVCAIGQPLFLKKEMVKKNVIIIDVGINRVNERIVGDADFDNIVDKAKYITPVPGGVGPMTVLSLLENTFKLYLLHQK
jgi:methylenetetrahydrofolate dehydrogenase (NADP+)/methenyltetrahydrofolate cyclohydrolase